MTKVYSSDLSEANNSVMITQLQSTINTNTKLINQLINFKTESVTNLQGSGYDVLTSKLSYYIDSLTKGNTISENMIAAIKSANNKMLNFMEGYDFLDDSQIPEIERSLQAARQLLNWLQSYHTEYSIDPLTGDEVQVSVRNGTDAEISTCQNTIAELTALLEKLKALAGEDAKDYGDVSDVEKDILGFGKALENGYLAGRGIGSINTSNMTEEAKKQLEYYSQFWPDDLSPERTALLQSAFELYDQDIAYNQQYRGQLREDGQYKFLDCSSFIRVVYEKAGIDAPWVSDEGTRTSTFRDENSGFEYIDKSQLRPGDLLEWNEAYTPNHVVMYIGKDEYGNDSFIECTGRNTEYFGQPNAIDIETLQHAHDRYDWDFNVVLRYTGLPD